MVYRNLKIDIANLKVLLFILCSIGIVTLYSASSNIALMKFSDYKYIFLNQLVRLIIGLILLIIASFIDYKFYRKYSKLILFFCLGIILMEATTIIIAVPTREKNRTTLE